MCNSRREYSHNTLTTCVKRERGGKKRSSSSSVAQPPGGTRSTLDFRVQNYLVNQYSRDIPTREIPLPVWDGRKGISQKAVSNKRNENLQSSKEILSIPHHHTGRLRQKRAIRHSDREGEKNNNTLQVLLWISLYHGQIERIIPSRDLQLNHINLLV